MIRCDKRRNIFQVSGEGGLILEEYMIITERLKLLFMDELTAEFGKDTDSAHEIADKLMMDSVAFALCSPEEQTEILRRKNDGI